MKKIAIVLRITNRQVAWTCFLLALIAAAAQVLIPQFTQIDNTVDQAKIHFYTSRSNVLFLTDCLTVGWDVEHTQSVYLNGVGQVGTGSQIICLSSGQPTLTVNMTDGTSQTYKLPVKVLTNDPAFQLTLLLEVAISLFCGRIIRSVVAIVTILGLGIQFSGNISQPLPATFSSFLSLWALVTVAILIYVHRLFPAVRTDDHPPFEQDRLMSAQKYPIRAWIFGFALAMIIVVTTIFVVNPLGKYFSTTFRTYANPARSTKLNFYAQLEHAPDIVIIGSSLTFSISPTYIKDKLGYTAFNAGLDGGRIADAIPELRFFLDHSDRTLPKVIWFEVDPGIDTAYSWAASTLQPDMIK